MKKKITKIILAVCLVVAGLPLFAIGARANDDANTNSEMMISVDNYFDYRKAEEEENQRLFGKAYQKNDYVFKWPDGRTFAPDYVTHHFSKMLERYGMPHIRFHELRHSCASLLLNNGCGLKDVQEWMGHSDIQTTANIYGHLDTSRKQSLADKLTECLNERC